jgi:hypothetical protein
MCACVRADVEFESDFLYSYRDFTTPADLFECLTQRFHSVGPMTHPDTYAIVRKRYVAFGSTFSLGRTHAHAHHRTHM